MDLVVFYMIWINLFLPNVVVSYLCEPHTLITVAQLYFNNHCHAQFGTYAETHEDMEPSNTIKPCTTSAIFLGTMENLQVSYNRFIINTVRVIRRKQCTQCTIQPSIIFQVKTPGRKDGIPIKT